MGPYEQTMPYETERESPGRAGPGLAAPGRRRLAEVCSPLFLFLTAFRRNSTTTAMSLPEVRSRLMEVLDGIKEQCDDDHRLSQLLQQVWYTLVVTCDQAILSSSWSEKVPWSMDLLETHVFSSAEGGNRFYEVVEENLAKPGEDAAEVAEVLYTCMALGFQGELLGDRRRFERKRMALFEKARLSGMSAESLTPEAYGRNVSRTLVRLPKVGLMRVALVGVVLLLTLWVIGTQLANHYMATTRSDIADLEKAVPADAGSAAQVK